MDIRWRTNGEERIRQFEQIVIALRDEGKAKKLLKLLIN